MMRVDFNISEKMEQRHHLKPILACCGPGAPGQEGTQEGQAPSIPVPTSVSHLYR